MILQQPANIIANANDSFVLICVNNDGNPKPYPALYQGVVSIAIGTNPGGGTLSGTTSINAVAPIGTFTFAPFTIDQPGFGYTLVTNDNPNSVRSITSNPFNVTNPWWFRFVVPPTAKFPPEPGDPVAAIVAKLDLLHGPVEQQGGAVDPRVAAELRQFGHDIFSANDSLDRAIARIVPIEGKPPAVDVLNLLDRARGAAAAGHVDEARSLLRQALTILDGAPAGTPIGSAPPGK
jgi:hypothetical protein